MPISLPPLPEQSRIVAVLETWDKAIEKLTEKIEMKKNIKKGLMQDLLFGKRRLPTFKEKWKNAQLVEVCNINMGQSPSSAAYNENGKGLPLIQGNNDIKNKKTVSRIWTTEITKIANKGDLIMTVRAPVGNLGIAQEKICIGRGVCAISASNNSDVNFIFQILKSYELKWKSLEQGSTFTAVNSSDIKRLKISIPLFKNEQAAIANIFITADNEIETLEKKLSFLKDQKKYLLNNLVTGEIRTPVNMAHSPQLKIMPI